MTVCIYIMGVIAALVVFALDIYYEDKRLTIGTLTISVICSLFSWFAVLGAILTSLIHFIDWDKELWRKKE